MAIKSSRGVTSGKGTPQRLEGQNGDITIRSTPFGKKLFVKDANKWHSINLNVNILNISKQIELISKEVDKLKFKKNNKPILDKVALRKSGSANIQLKNNSGALNIRNAADDGDIQLGIGYGGTGSSTEDGALSNLGGTTTGINVFKASDAAGARSAIGAGTGSGTVTASSTDTFTNKTFDANGTGNSLSNVDMASDVTGTLPAGNGGTGLTSISTLLNSNTSKSDVGLSDVTNDAQLPIAGGQMTGNITFSGSQTVDGRDLSSDGSKLDGVASGATANDTDVNLKARANHTGSQAASTISDFNSVADGRIDTKLAAFTGSSNIVTTGALTATSLQVTGDIAQNNTIGVSSTYGFTSRTTNFAIEGYTVAASVGSITDTCTFTDSDPTITPDAANTGIEVGQLVKGTGIPTDGNHPYVGAITESGGAGNGVTSFELHRDGAAINPSASSSGGGNTITFDSSSKTTLRLLSNNSASMIHFSTSGVANPWQLGVDTVAATYNSSFALSDAPFIIGQSSAGGTAEEFSNGEKFKLDTNGNITIPGDIALGSNISFTSTAGETTTLSVSDTTGVVTLASLGDGTTDSDIILDADGDVKLDAASGIIRFDKVGSNYGFFADGGNLTLKHDILLNPTTGETTTMSVADDTGVFTIATDASTSTTAGIVLDSGGDITLDSASGNFIASKAGQEFSAANSAYAGMILGYTRIQNDGTASADSLINLSSTMTVLQTNQGTNVTIQFRGPPSGNVEIQFSCRFYSSSTSVGFALSSLSSFSEIDETHTYDAGSHRMDETDIDVINVNWAVTGLTPGTLYTYFIAGQETSGSTSQISHGRFRTGGKHYPPIIVKAIALPATLVTGE